MTQTDAVPEPTGEQCSENAVVYRDEHKIGYALWYPQMGGYAGKAVALIDQTWEESENGARQGGCVDVLVWHDGEFPFGDGQNPIEIHHCAPEQFVSFGCRLRRLNNKHRQ